MNGTVSIKMRPTSARLPLFGGLLAVAGAAGKLLERGITEAFLNTPEGMVTAGTSLILQAAGAVAIPIFVFLSASRIKNSASGGKHLALVLFLAAALEIPYDLICFGKVTYPESQSPAMAIMLATALLYFWERLESKNTKNILIKTAVLIAALLWSLILHVEAGAMCIILAALTKMLEGKRQLLPFAVCAFLASAAVASPIYALAPLGAIAVSCCNRNDTSFSKK